MNRFFVKIDEHNRVLALASVSVIDGVDISKEFEDWVEIDIPHLSGWIGKLDVLGIPAYKVENGEFVLRTDAMIRADFIGDIGDK